MFVDRAIAACTSISALSVKKQQSDVQRSTRRPAARQRVLQFVQRLVDEYLVRGIKLGGFE
jgi:hypothetical protein